jgi:hypothetical protein
MTGRVTVAMRMPKYGRQGGGGRFALRGWTCGCRPLQDIGSGRSEEKVRLRKDDFVWGSYTVPPSKDTHLFDNSIWLSQLTQKLLIVYEYYRI